MEELFKPKVEVFLDQANLKKLLRNQPIIYGIRKFFKYLLPRLTVFHLINKLYLLLLLNKSQYYQPLYNFSVIQKKRPERICIDRADAIYQSLMPEERGGRVLDIGCNLGFFSFYFSDRGFEVRGLDSNPKHIQVCRLLQKINQGKTHFSIGEFSETFLHEVSANQYDIVFLFSVMHHVSYARGFEYAQNLMKALLEKIPILFIELATTQEPADLHWHDSVPDDELQLFAKCPNIRIEKIGSFTMNRNGIDRPLYKVSKS